MNTRTLDGEIIATRLDDVRTYDGVRTRRVFAFLIDYLIVGLLLIPFAILVFLLGLLTLGLDGKPVDGMLAVVHSVLFWAANVVLTPLILLVSLFADRKRTAHDLLLGTVVTRSDR